MAKISPLQIYRLLPGTNCRECGETTCMAFASALIERKKTYEDCMPLKEEKYAEQREKLIELTTPPIKEVIIGTGDRAVAIGGEEVMYRHELTYFNPTAFFLDVHDEMSEKELNERLERIKKFSVTRIGQKLTLDGIAVRSKSDDAVKFGEAVLNVVEKCDLPLVICSLNPELLEVGLEIAAKKRPLIYAATKEKWNEVAKLALKYSCPVVASSPGDMQGLIDLVQNLLGQGTRDIVLDIGSYPKGEKFYEMTENLAMLRRLAIENEVRVLGFPILGVPCVIWMEEKEPVRGAMAEATLAAVQMLRFCDMLILHSLDTWALLPLLTLRQNIYTDPRVPVSVQAGLNAIGKPDENSPLLFTSNFALTYYTVAGDLESSKVSCYVLVVDTGGLAVEASMAGGKLTAEGVKRALEETKASEKVKHNKLIIPGRAARISGEIEDAAGWEVMVGPVDSSKIGAYLEEKWR
jgi:acetyl-CoA decarbonylase/synthase complex subunit gamma